MTLFSPSAPGKLRVDIWSDIACPWCYIGKRRLEQALQGFPQRDQVEVVWHSFELDPSAPVQGPLSLRDGLARKYRRTPEQAQEMLDSMTHTAAGEGLDYHFERAQPTNTFLAHQLLHLAAEKGLGDAMKERLLRAYLSEGEFLGDRETLVRLASEVGLDAAEVRAALESGKYAQAVRQDEAQAQALGISGVPFFVLGGKYGVSGAQSPDVLRGALEQVWKETHPAPLTLLGQDTPAEGCEDGQCALPQRDAADTRG
ncbi:DsbA family oxidoreductase [Deinococcus metallilatus]|uniref:DsbA family dithiol-disulfide isomerase n=1 Tax=Deinococcus metallilatus TaxID=1211322 RepID=A0AAJ5F0U3_9DEIO|nr:DsbA family oxidoreductase [Deinococcus metallilatus]MBB5296167.1 putative DsbA family dithiol-disulfide isomerase [Deinococcus metallilatus]QBY09783.1 DsbA family oxidoreductase [Deinococcus metallilatus]RXJ08981.1 DsbA family oxidoreductase [Deinococcus metallilatus]TLK23640.1 DsbA family oxidoreductase [Deinococcus metallilatus]GMA14033.1 DSBA oxidoreductase [Deinococcus metallilatus]